MEDYPVDGPITRLMGWMSGIIIGQAKLTIGFSPTLTVQFPHGDSPPAPRSIFTINKRLHEAVGTNTDAQQVDLQRHRVMLDFTQITLRGCHGGPPGWRSPGPFSRGARDAQLA
jgi:hypothetical protein